MKPADEIRFPMNLTVLVKFGDAPDMRPDSAACLDFDEVSGWEAKPLGSELVALAREVGPHAPYDLTVTEGHMSWGADGSFAEAAIYIGCEVAKYATGAAIEETVRRTFNRIVRKSRGRIAPLDREMAISIARQRVAVAFSECADDLQITEEEEQSPGIAWAITVQSRSSSDTYRVSVCRVKRRAVRTLITRARGPLHAD